MKNENTMILTYKVLSLLLDYPTEMLQKSLSGIGGQLREERFLDETSIGHIETFVGYASSLSLTEWQEQYVTLFDQGTGANLYLFDYAYGSSRDRGQAMVDLKAMYLDSGFIPCAEELPDYLPLFLEFLAIQSDTEKAGKLLSETSQVLIGMRKQIDKQQTPYAGLIDVVCQLAGKGGE